VFVFAAEPQLMLTAGPGMMAPGFSPGYAPPGAAYAPNMPYQGYGM
jgi:hypothetical protein